MRTGRILLSMVACVLSLTLSGMASAQQWAKAYGGEFSDNIFSIRLTADGGYIAVGVTYSFSGNSSRAWVLRLDGTGVVEWQKTYGSDGSAFTSIQPTADGGYIAVGKIAPVDSPVSGPGILKLDGTGVVIWQKTYGLGSGDELASIQRTTDGGYIAVGTTASFGNAGYGGGWILKLDETGDIQWQHGLQPVGAGPDHLVSIQQTVDGGYIAAGTTTTLLDIFDTDGWVLKLDRLGNVTWQKRYGGTKMDTFGPIRRTLDGGYIVAGTTRSFGAGHDDQDAWILKLDGTGDIQWQKTYGGTSDDFIHSIQQTVDGGYIAAGGTRSFGAWVGGVDNAWILKLDGTGDIQWQKTYGGTRGDFTNSIQQTADRGYIAAGATRSFTTSGSSDDAWILKLDSSGNIAACTGQGTSNATVKNTAVTGLITTHSIVNSLLVPVTTTSPTSQSTTAPTRAICVPFTLTVTRAGRGVVTSNSAGIDCGATCAASYASGTPVSLTATPDPDYTFTGWGGDCGGQGNSCSLTMTGPKSVTATFTAASTGGLTPSSPTAVIEGTTLHLVVRGLDNHLYLNSRSGGTWSGWSEVPGGGLTLSQPAAILDSSGALRLYIQGIDNRLYINTRTGGSWSGWSEVSGNGLTLSGPEAVLDGSLGRLFVRGLDSHVYTALATTPPYAEVPGGGLTPSSPAAVMDGTTLHLVVRGTDSRIYLNSRSGGTWSGWSEVPGGGLTPNQPAAVLDSGGSLRLYVQGMGNGIWVNTRTGATWSGWSEVPGGGLTPSGPEAVLDGGSVRLVVQGIDNRIYIITP